MCNLKEEIDMNILYISSCISIETKTYIYMNLFLKEYYQNKGNHTKI
jgi:hypothetical protein